MKILLAEDHDNLREIIEDYLVVHGYVVESFDNGEDAYYSFLTESYDLVLLDVMMPKMDGFTLCKKIREKEEIPILFITAKVQEVDQLKGYELGCDDYIIKPFSLPVLLAKCNAIMNRKHYQFLERGVLKLNTREKQAYLNNKNLNLKIIDYKILEYFIKNGSLEGINRNDPNRDSWFLRPSLSRETNLEISKNPLRKAISPCNLV